MGGGCRAESKGTAEWAAGSVCVLERRAALRSVRGQLSASANMSSAHHRYALAGCRGCGCTGSHTRVHCTAGEGKARGACGTQADRLFVFAHVVLSRWLWLREFVRVYLYMFALVCVGIPSRSRLQRRRLAHRPPILPLSATACAPPKPAPAAPYLHERHTRHAFSNTKCVQNFERCIHHVIYGPPIPSDSVAAQPLRSNSASSATQ